MPLIFTLILVLDVISGLRENIKIFGDDYDTPDGSGVRDYIHVVDLAIGHIKAIEFLFENDPQVISLNIGTGEGTSVLKPGDITIDLAGASLISKQTFSCVSLQLVATIIPFCCKSKSP